MIGLFVKFFPYLLVLYFLYRSYREPVFMLGIPFLMFLGPAVFFDQVVLFQIPFRSFDSISQNQDIFLFVWLIIFWIIFRIRSESYPTEMMKNHLPEKRLNIYDYLVISLVIVTIIGFVMVLNEYYLLDKVYDKFIVLLSMFFGFFIFKDIVYRIEPEVLHKFLYSIVIINSMASGLYFIHQGLHIEIYQGVEYLTTIFQGATITRTFWFSPPLWGFSIAYLLIFRKDRSFVFIALLAINLLAIYISYTRSTLVANVFLIVLFFILNGLKNGDYSSVLKNLIIISVAGIALFWAISNFMPASTNYFLSRFKELKEQPADKQSNNLVYRFFKTDMVIKKMNTERDLFGYGPVTERQLQYVKVVDIASADMGWAEVIFRWGYLGLALFIILFVTSLIKSFFLFLRTEGIVSQLSLLILLSIISLIIEGFTSFSIMAPNRFAFGLWYLGILSALLIYKKSGTNANESVVLETEIN
jgi:hypothetical protein